MENNEILMETDEVLNLTDASENNDETEKCILNRITPGPESCRIWWDW